MDTIITITVAIITITIIVVVIIVVIRRDDNHKSYIYKRLYNCQITT